MVHCPHREVMMRAEKKKGARKRNKREVTELQKKKRENKLQDNTHLSVALRQSSLVHSLYFSFYTTKRSKTAATSQSSKRDGQKRFAFSQIGLHVRHIPYHFTHTTTTTTTQKTPEFSITQSSTALQHSAIAPFLFLVCFLR